MKFLVILKATPDSEAGIMPAPEHLEAATRFNEELAKDGVLLAAEGLWPSSKDSARLEFGPKGPTQVDGPFAETKELVGGFWMIKADSRDEVIERFKRAPFSRGETVEIRRMFVPEDFAEFASPEMIERWEKV